MQPVICLTSLSRMKHCQFRFRPKRANLVLEQKNNEKFTKKKGYKKYDRYDIVYVLMLHFSGRQIPISKSLSLKDFSIDPS